MPPAAQGSTPESSARAQEDATASSEVSAQGAAGDDADGPDQAPAPIGGGVPALERTQLPSLGPDLIAALKQLALWGAHVDHVVLSSSQLGEALGLKQQTASKRILDLQAQGLISRRMGGRKQAIRLSDLGIATLRAELMDYQRIFEGVSQLHARGKVVSGLGEGGYYISMEPYMVQFEEKLHFRPYPGTLNVELDGPELAKLALLRTHSGLELRGFSHEGRTFGGAHLFHASIRGVTAAVVLPDRTHHTKTLEVISPHYLRGQLGLEDDTEVEVVVDL